MARGIVHLGSKFKIRSPFPFDWKRRPVKYSSTSSPLFSESYFPVTPITAATTSSQSEGFSDQRLSTSIQGSESGALKMCSAQAVHVDP